MCFIFLIISLSASDAFAVQPYVCDPESDPFECRCPTSDEFDACYKVQVEDLPSANDPVLLRDLANITSSWNAEEELWEVTIDATQLPAAGVINLHGNGGEWQSVEELHEYLGALIGQDLSPMPDEAGQVFFPPMRIQQKGVTARYDEGNSEWAMVHSGSMIHDAITGTGGVLVLDTIPFDLIFGGDDECGSRSPDAFDREADGDLKGEQCSTVKREAKQIPNCAEGGPCTYIVDSAHTLLETADSVHFGATISCEAGELKPCEAVTGWIVHRRILADELTMRSVFFDQYASFSGENDWDPGSSPRLCVTPSFVS